MDRASKTGSVVTALGVAIVLVLVGLYEWAGLGLGETLGASIIASIATGAEAWIVWYRDRPHMKVRALPHLRGWSIPSEKEEDYLLVPSLDPAVPSTYLPLRHAVSHPEREGHGIHLSQVAELLWMDPRANPAQQARVSDWEPAFAVLRRSIASRRELILKFGVVGVRNEAADARDCRVTLRYRRKGEELWWGPWEAGWYSSVRKVTLQRDYERLEELYLSPGKFPDELLTVESIDIGEGEEADLPIFYMRKGLGYVYACGHGRPMLLGNVGDRTPVEFEVAIELYAKGAEVRRVAFHAKASWVEFDEFEVVEEPWPKGLPPGPPPSAVGG